MSQGKTRAIGPQMLPARFRSLPGRIMSLVGLVFVFLIVLVFASVGLYVYQMEAEAWRGRQLEAARNAAQTVSAFLQRNESALLWVDVFGIDEVSAPGQSGIGILLQNNPSFVEIVHLDQSGAVLTDAALGPAVLANLFTIAQSEWFRAARAGRSYYTQVQISAQGEPYLIYARPTHDGGVIAARIKMDVLWEVVSGLHFGRGGSAFVIASSGQVIAHTDRNVVLASSSLAGRPELPAILQARGYEWSGPRLDFNRQPVVSVSTPIAGTDWIVITDLPQSEAYASTRALLTVLPLGVLGVAAVVISILRRNLTAILRSVEILRAGAQRLGQGDLSYRITELRNDELGDVMLVFNTMAEQVDKQQAALERRATELNALYVTSLAINAQSELSALLPVIIERAARLLAAPMAGLYMTEPDGQSLKLQVGFGLRPEYTGVTLRLGEGVAGTVAQTGEPLMVEDYREWAGRASVYEDSPFRRVLGMPLKQKNQIIGVIVITDNVKTGPFSEDEIHLASLFADQAATALEKTRLYEASQRELAERQRMADALRALNEQLEERVKARTLELTRLNADLSRENAERKRVEAELEAQRDFGLQVMNTMGQGLTVTNRDRQFEFVNPAYARMVGYAPEQLVGKTSMDLTVAEDRTALDQAHARRLEGAVTSYETRLQRADGSAVNVLVTGTPRWYQGRMAGSIAVVTDLTDQKRVEEQIRASLHEKEVLLKEIHHRVKNNLQIISSLLALQAKQVQGNPEAAVALGESQQRVRSMALIHEKLYQSQNLAEINLADYIRQLVTSVVRSYQDGAEVDLRLDLEEVALGVDQAMPCGLILNELITNALKYAFRGSRHGTLRVELHGTGGHSVELRVADDGPGLPPGLDIRRTRSLGLQLVTGLVDQLQGTVEVAPSGGADFRIAFPCLV